MGKARRYIWQAVLILYIAFIFSNSLMAKIHALLGAIGMRDVSWLTEHLIRKGAHFTEYTLMGILLFRSMKTLDCGKIVIVRKIHEAAVFMIPFVRRRGRSLYFVGNRSDRRAPSPRRPCETQRPRAYWRMDLKRARQGGLRRL